MGIKERIGRIGEVRNLPERISDRAFKFFEYGVEIQIRKSSQLPLSEKQKALKSIISKVQQLFRRASTVHRQRRLLGLCYREVGNQIMTLNHDRLAVELAGADNPTRDIFEMQFLNDLRTLLQNNIPNLRGKRRAQALQTIGTVLSWTTHLLTNCPDLKYHKEISHEIDAATKWLQKDAALIIISEIGPQTTQTS